MTYVRTYVTTDKVDAAAAATFCQLFSSTSTRANYMVLFEVEKKAFAKMNIFTLFLLLRFRRGELRGASPIIRTTFYKKKMKRKEK